MFLCDEINTIFFCWKSCYFVKYGYFYNNENCEKKIYNLYDLCQQWRLAILFLKIPIKWWSKNTIVYINKQITYEQLRKSRNNYSKNVKFGADDKCFDEKQNN